jgi:hypothetical protein
LLVFMAKVGTTKKWFCVGVEDWVVQFWPFLALEEIFSILTLCFWLMCN